MSGQYNSDGMADILLQCKVDVGPSSYWSELAGLRSLDNLLSAGHINKLQYFERISKMNIIPDVQGLIKDAQAEMESMAAQAQQQQAMQQGQMAQQQGMEQEQMMQDGKAKEQRFEQMAQFMEALPKEVQYKIMRLPAEEQEKTIMQLMQQDVKNTAKGAA